MTKNNSCYSLLCLFSKTIILLLFISSCARPFVKNPPKDKFYLYKNSIEIENGSFSKTQQSDLIQKLNLQLEDSSKIKVAQYLFLLKIIKSPLIYNDNAAKLSAENMQSSMFHIGYYHSKVNYSCDTTKKRVSVTYKVLPNNPTTIEEIKYDLKLSENKELLKNLSEESYLKKQEPITKINVLSEVNRLVDSFRNNGYYKFSSSEIKVQGDTTNESLISISGDPLEQLKLLSKAQERIDNPTIKLSVSLTPATDSSKLQRYYINKISIWPDYQIDKKNQSIAYQTITTKKYQIFYQNKIINPFLFDKLIDIKSGDLYSQLNYNNALFNLSKTGVWQNVSIEIEEDSVEKNKVNLNIQLIPAKKYLFDNSLELSYSASNNNSTVLAGNLFGLSENLSIVNRNLFNQAIRMTNKFRVGVELNNNNFGNKNLINTTEFSYENATVFPRIILKPIPNLFGPNQNTKGETFINFGVSNITRLNLFSLRSANAGFGWSGTKRNGWKWNWTSLNFAFSNLYKESDSFALILEQNPFLRFSYNTAFASGMSLGFSKTFSNKSHTNSLTNETSIRLNAEESGLTWGLIPIINNYKRRFIKTDAEIKRNIVYNKTAIALRGFVGIGVPLLGIDTNRTLPFFKQYYGGGSNSMRAWPIRGIGPGGKPLLPYSTNKSFFNDRSGDIQFEINSEYRFDIIRIIPNTLTLKGVVFSDIGNIWNLYNNKSDRSTDNAQFNFKTFYSQLGVTGGTGFRFDFNYFVVRFDFGFRFKRPELFYINDGWQAPNISFKDCIKKIFLRGNNDEYRKWRYENFNFSIGIGYPF